MAKVYLKRRSRFSASHRLHSAHLSDEENAKLFGKCNWENGHGHNYVLWVTVAGNIDPKSGIVMDLVDLKKVIEENVIKKVDHRHLNFDIEEFKELNPTAENMVKVFWQWLEPALPENLLYELTLYETENNVAVYRGEG